MTIKGEWWFWDDREEVLRDRTGRRETEGKVGGRGKKEGGQCKGWTEGAAEER